MDGSRFLRPEVLILDPYVPGVQPADGDSVVKLNTNENPYPPAPAVLAAIQAELGLSLARYPSPDGEALRRAASAVYGLPADAILVGNGSDELLSLLVRAVAGRDGRVAAADPGYGLYRTLAALHGARFEAVPFAADFGLPARWPDAPLNLLTNPNSPSGTQVPPDLVAELARGLDGLLVVDEAYADFADAHCLGLLADHDNVVVLRTFSKSYSLAGLRLGLAFGPPELLAGMARLQDAYSVNRLALAAGVAALGATDALARNVRRIRATRDWLTEALVGRGLTVWPSQANFVLVEVGPVAARLQAWLAERGVLVRHLDHPRVAAALRVSIGSEPEVRMFLERFDEGRAALAPAPEAAS